MGAGTVIEIVRNGTRLPEKLILAAYRSSRFELAWFVLNGVGPPEVDLVLDPIVYKLPIFIPGVLYLDINDMERLRGPLALSGRLFFASERLRSIIEQARAYGGPSGRRCQPISCAAQYGEMDHVA